MTHRAPPLDPPDEAVLEALRRRTALRMATDGRLYLDDEAVTHPRVDEALRASIEPLCSGEFTVGLGSAWTYLVCEDLPFRVRSFSEAMPGHLVARLDDGREVPVNEAGFQDDDERGLSLAVLSRRNALPLRARVSNRALFDLDPWLRASETGFILQFGSQPRVVPRGRPLKRPNEATS